MLGLVDESLRDGPQSLWATRMSTKVMLEAAPLLNRATFRKVCVTSGAAFETAVRFLNDDPWERIELLNRLMPDATMDVLVRSRNLFGWQRYPDEVIELLFELLQKRGVKWLKVFDGLNDFDNIEACLRIGRRMGFKVAGLITFSLSPVHTDDYFVQKVRRFMEIGVDSVLFGDACGLMTGPRTERLLRAVKAEIDGRVPLEFLAHDNMGLGLEAYGAAIKVGVDTLTTASKPLANAESLPSTSDVLALCDELDVPTEVDRAVVRRLDDHFHWIAYREGHNVSAPVVFDPIRYERFAGHQIPGGMMSNFRNQLRELGLLHRIDEVLEEASRVRGELGYPVMVTPFSQFVGVQATYNVILGERYKQVPRELILYARGHYGTSPAPIEPNVLDRIFNGKGVDPIDNKEVFGARILDNFRRDNGPFSSNEDMLLQLFYGRAATETMRRSKNSFFETPSIDQPLQVLIRELTRVRRIGSIKLEGRGMNIQVKYNAASVSEKL